MRREVTMRKGLQYLDRAVECRKIAHQVRDAQHRQQLDDMAREWEALASEYATELEQAAKRAQKPTGGAFGYWHGGEFHRARPFLYLVKG